MSVKELFQTKRMLKTRSPIKRDEGVHGVEPMIYRNIDALEVGVHFANHHFYCLSHLLHSVPYFLLYGKSTGATCYSTIYVLILAALKAGRRPLHRESRVAG